MPAFVPSCLASPHPMNLLHPETLLLAHPSFVSTNVSLKINLFSAIAASNLTRNDLLLPGKYHDVSVQQYLTH